MRSAVCEARRASSGVCLSIFVSANCGWRGTGRKSPRRGRTWIAALLLALPVALSLCSRARVWVTEGGGPAATRRTHRTAERRRCVGRVVSEIWCGGWWDL